jgi:hypothetical protein
VKLEELTDDMVTVVMPLKIGDVRESIVAIDRSSDDGASDDL